MGVGVGTGEGALHQSGSMGQACVILGSDQRLVCCQGRGQRECEVCKTEQGGYLETSQSSPMSCRPSSQGKVLFTNYTFSIKFMLMGHGRQCPLDLWVWVSGIHSFISLQLWCQNQIHCAKAQLRCGPGECCPGV